MDRIGANLMDATAFNLLAGLALGALGLAGWWVLRGTPQGSGEAGRAPNACAAPIKPLSLEETDALLAPHRGRLRAIRERSRFSAVSFERDCLGLMRRVLAHPHYANAGRSGEVHALLTQAYHSLGYRQAMLLPPGALAEDIEPRSYRWTFGVFVAALLHDLRWSGAWGAATPAGLREQLQPWVEPLSLQWLLEDPDLSQQLQEFFSQPQGNNVLHRLVRSGRNAVQALEASAPAADSLAPAVLAQAVPAAPPVSLTPPMPAAVLAPLAVPTAAASDAPALESGPALAQSFMQWLSQGLADQSIPVNAPDARVHFAADGMVLVAPGIFHEYALVHTGGQPTTTPPEVAACGKEVLRAVCAQGWHLRGPQNANMHRFQFKRGGDGKTPPVLRALVIQSPQRFIATPPAPHPGLSRLM